MNKAEFLQDLQQKISDLMRQSPAAEIEKNLKALLSQGFARLELVTREEFDVQREVLARTRAKLNELEKRLNDLEQNLPQ
ncbi:MAG: accessory factor UbiK family protein [Burkholderiaceae bacterium]|jgi:BMFP domain-containing protein YqiC